MFPALCTADVVERLGRDALMLRIPSRLGKIKVFPTSRGTLYGTLPIWCSALGTADVVEHLERDALMLRIPS